MIKQKEWHVEDYINRLLPIKGDLTSSFNTVPRQQLKSEDITLELLEECYVYMAHIVSQYGEHYLPIFERLHVEIKVMRDKQKMMDTVRQISKTFKSPL